MKFCAACSMPLPNELFIGKKNGEDLFCTFCIDENQKIKSCEEIFQGGVHYFLNNKKFTKDMAEKITRTTMSSLPFWKGNTSPCLQGEMLTDAEIREIFPASKEI